jgi:hypothetical protein
MAVSFPKLTQFLQVNQLSPISLIAVSYLVGLHEATTGMIKGNL